MNIQEELAAAAKTNRERGEVYGDSARIFGDVAAALFPEGMKLETAEDWARFGLLCQIISKLTRYAQALRTGQLHADSTHDLGVYALMLTKFDADKQT